MREPKLRATLRKVVSACGMILCASTYSSRADDQKVDYVQDVRDLVERCLQAIQQESSAPFSDWNFVEMKAVNERRLSPDERYRLFFGPTSFSEPPDKLLNSCVVVFEYPNARRNDEALAEVARAAADLIGTQFEGFTWRAGKKSHPTKQPKALACVNGYTIEVFASQILNPGPSGRPALKVGYSWFDPGPCD